MRNAIWNYFQLLLILLYKCKISMQNIVDSLRLDLIIDNRIPESLILIVDMRLKRVSLSALQKSAQSTWTTLNRAHSSQQTRDTAVARHMLAAGRGAVQTGRCATSQVSTAEVRSCSDTMVFRKYFKHMDTH